MKTVRKNWRQTGTILAVLGPLVAIAGVSARYFIGEWGWVPLSLLIGGLCLLVLGLACRSQASTASGNIWERGSVQAGTNAIVATLAVLVILGGINFLGVRYSTRFDLTENQLYTLAPQTRSLLENLDQPIQVWVFDRQPNSQVRQLLEDYRRRAEDQLTFEFVDPQLRPGLAQRLEVRSIGEVYVERGTKRQFVQNVAQQPLSEPQLTGALEQVLQDNQEKVYLLQGHGERPLDQLSQATRALGEKGFDAEALNLAEQLARAGSGQAIPEDATAIVIVGPQREFFPSEVKALQTYLDQGGGLLLLLDPNTDPKLDPLLESWGVDLDDRLVLDVGGGGFGVDPAGNLVGFGPTAPLITNYGNHPITQDFRNNNSFYPESRALTTNDVEGVTTTALLLTSSNSWAESNLDKDPVEFNPEEDLRGPLTLGVALERQTGDTNADGESTASDGGDPESEIQLDQTSGSEIQPSARLVIIGNSSYMVDGLFSQQLNGDVFLNSVVWLSQQGDQPLSVRPREATDRRLAISPAQIRVVFLLAVILLPLLGLSTAVGLWWQRR